MYFIFDFEFFMHQQVMGQERVAQYLCLVQTENLLSQTTTLIYFKLLVSYL